MIDDTRPEVRRRMDEAYRRMSPQEKLARVADLTLASHQMALARIRAEHPSASDRELRLRLASLWIDASLMKRAFGWDPDVEGR